MSSWFVPAQLPSSDCLVFCFPYAGGGAGAFKDFQHADPRFVAVQYPGREKRMGEPAITSMESLVDAVINELEPVARHRYALFGHSLGAKVAFRVVLGLVKRGLPLPCHLFVAGCSAPFVPEPRPIYHLDDAGFIEGLRRYEATPSEILDNPQIVKFFLPMLRADFTISDTFAAHKEEQIPIFITALSGQGDEDGTPVEMMRWKESTNAGFELVEFKGGHFFPFEKPAEVLAVLQKRLAALQ